ncbi:MAG: circadian clock protein KaiC [Ginsengibacter sp.]
MSKTNPSKTKRNAKETGGVKKRPTGIPGFEEISYGGLPVGRATLITGTAGSGKTIFACHYLAGGIMQFNEQGVFVSFEENVQDLKKNVKEFNWDFQQLEDDNKVRFVDGSTGNDAEIVGDYDLSGLLLRIEAAIREVKARRVVLDSLGSLFNLFNDPTIIRREIFRLLSFLKKKNIVILITSERLEEYGLVSRFGVEEYVADNVIILRNVLENEKRRRTIEILKYRGSEHSRGEQSFVISVPSGINIIPLTRLQLKQKSSSQRVTSGNKRLDEMCNGGFYRDSIVLVSGATGTGKTLMATEFINGGYESNERILLLAFEESREQLIRNAEGWGVDFVSMEKAGKLKIVAIYPETAGLEEHLLDIENIILDFKPNRVAIDSLSAIERGSSKKNFREFLIALTSFLKQHEITSLFTSTTTTLNGGPSVTDSHISTITDSIILLRYAENNGNMDRVVTVLKMRGSIHAKEIFEFEITSDGMIISGNHTHREGIVAGMSLASFTPTVKADHETIN